MREPGAEEGFQMPPELVVRDRDPGLRREMFSSAICLFLSLKRILKKNSLPMEVSLESSFPIPDYHLRKLKHPEIFDCKIMRSDHTGKSLSYGFMRFASDAIARRVIEEKNGVAIKGRNLRCLLFFFPPSTL